MAKSIIQKSLASEVKAVEKKLQWRVIQAEASLTFTANSNGTFHFDVTDLLPSGYRIMSVVDFSVSGTYSEYLVFRSITFSNTKKSIDITFRCLTTSSSVTANCVIYFLAVPSSIVT